MWHSAEQHASSKNTVYELTVAHVKMLNRIYKQVEGEVLDLVQELAVTNSLPEVWSKNKLTSTPFLQASVYIKYKCLCLIADRTLTSESGVCV